MFDHKRRPIRSLNRFRIWTLSTSAISSYGGYTNCAPLFSAVPVSFSRISPLHNAPKIKFPVSRCRQRIRSFSSPENPASLLGTDLFDRYLELNKYGVVLRNRRWASGRIFYGAPWSCVIVFHKTHFVYPFKGYPVFDRAHRVFVWILLVSFFFLRKKKEANFWLLPTSHRTQPQSSSS